MIELGDEKVLYAFDKDAGAGVSGAFGDDGARAHEGLLRAIRQRPEDELDEIDWDHINPATGPIFVEGVLGGALKVTIEAIEFDGQTASCTGEGEGCAAIADARSTHLCKIDGDELGGTRSCAFR